MHLFQRKKASALLTTIFVLLFLSGLNILIEDHHRQVLANLQGEIQLTRQKILLNRFILAKRKKPDLSKFESNGYGKLQLDSEKYVTIFPEKGKSVKLKFDEDVF